jgi:hypothetical protein
MPGIQRIAVLPHLDAVPAPLGRTPKRITAGAQPFDVRLIERSVWSPRDRLDVVDRRRDGHRTDGAERSRRKQTARQ